MVTRIIKRYDKRTFTVEIVPWRQKKSLANYHIPKCSFERHKLSDILLYERHRMPLFGQLN